LSRLQHWHQQDYAIPDNDDRFTTEMSGEWLFSNEAC